MNQERMLPEGLRYALMLEVNPEEYKGHAGQLKALKLSCELTSGGVRFSYSWDYLPDKELFRDQLRYRVDYLSRNLRAALHEALAKFFNESKVATDIETGQHTPDSANELLEGWSDVISRGARSRINIPKKPLGRRSEVEATIVESADVIYAAEYKIFKRAKDWITKFMELFGPRKEKWPKDWRESLIEVLGGHDHGGGKRLEFAERFISSSNKSRAEPDATISVATYAYLAEEWKLSETYVPRFIRRAKRSRDRLK